ncbi:MAG: RidA family protein [Parvibaculaceae bacterium]
MTIRRLGVEGGNPLGLPMAPAVRAGDFIFISGQAALEPDGSVVAGGIAAQTRKTIERLIEVLRVADCTLADVVKATVWIADARDFAAFNSVFREYFGDHPPARSTLVSQLVVDAKVEIELVAYRPLPR